MVAVVIAFLLKTFLAQAFYIPSESMVPQLERGDRVVVSKLSYRFHEPRRGDVLVFHSPLSQPRREGALPVRIFREALEAIGIRRPGEEELIKRLVGLPGERVEAKGGKVYIDGRELIEPYLDGVVTDDFGPVEVPDDHLFMMGDNRGNSQDSRRIGTIPIDEVVGRAVVRVWPPQRLAFL